MGPSLSPLSTRMRRRDALKSARVERRSRHLGKRAGGLGQFGQGLPQLPHPTRAKCAVHSSSTAAATSSAESARRSPRDRALRADRRTSRLPSCSTPSTTHHSGEDENIWPRLLERAAPHVELIRAWKAAPRGPRALGAGADPVGDLATALARAGALATAQDEFAAPRRAPRPWGSPPRTVDPVPTSRSMFLFAALGSVLLRTRPRP